MLNEKTISTLGKISSPKKHCQGCRDTTLDIAFAYAFQPIVDIRKRIVYAYEALVRGPNGESAYSVLSQVNDKNRYQFDQACRVEAVKTAARLGMEEPLSINFLPNAVYEPSACIRTTLDACITYQFPTSQILFEVTEGERIDDRPHLISIFQHYESYGFMTAIDDFGAGYAGLNLLSEYQPTIVKIDMDLVRNIHLSKAKQAIVSGTLMTCKMLGALVVAEGIETREERDFLAGLGVELMQGYFFCRPAFQSLGVIDASVWD